MTKVWFITGSSRDLGRSLTEAVLANGGKVAANSAEAHRAVHKQYRLMVHFNLSAR